MLEMRIQDSLQIVEKVTVNEIIKIYFTVY